MEDRHVFSVSASRLLNVESIFIYLHLELIYALMKEDKVRKGKIKCAVI